MTSTRNKWIDILKFIGILEIYLGHYGEAAGYFYGFVFTHHVPLFFFISGYLENLNEKSFLQTLIKKIKSILVPFCFFGLFSIIIFSINSKYDKATVLLLINDLLMGAIRNQFFAGSLWFLTALLFVFSFAFIILTYLQVDLLTYLPFVQTKYLLQCIEIVRPSIIIFFFICVSYALKEVEFLRKIGENTLYLCGNENVIKLIFPLIISLIGLNPVVSNPLSAIITSLILLLLVNIFLVSWQKNIIRIINKHLLR